MLVFAALFFDFFLFKRELFKKSQIGFRASDGRGTVAVTQPTQGLTFDESWTQVRFLWRHGPADFVDWPSPFGRRTCGENWYARFCLLFVFCSLMLLLADNVDSKDVSRVARKLLQSKPTLAAFGDVTKLVDYARFDNMLKQVVGRE
jgi:hypothetical protein